MQPQSQSFGTVDAVSFRQNNAEGGTPSGQPAGRRRYQEATRRHPRAHARGERIRVDSFYRAVDFSYWDLKAVTSK